MRHEAKNIPLRIADSRDVIFGPIGVPRFRRASPCVAVAEQDAAIQLKLLQQGLIGEITAFAMGDGKAKNRSRPRRIGERAVMALDPDMNVLANEVQSPIPDQRARQQTAFAENLEAIANSNHQTSVCGEAGHRGHDRRKARDRPAA